MLVPVVDVESRSASPANVPPVIDTVALARLRLSGSTTEADPDSVVAASCSVYCAVEAMLLSVGGSLTPMPETVGVWGALLSTPSFTTQVRVGGVLEP